MSLRIALSAATAAVLGFTSLVGLARADNRTPAARDEIRPPSYVDNQPNYTARSYAENPAQFQGRMEATMNDRIRRVASNVTQGTMPRQALFDAQEDREHVEARIRTAARDGVISRGEEREIQTMVQGIGAADHGYTQSAPTGVDLDRWQRINR